ncbi:sigma-70 family RNA polymerase sigma factor [Streptomyces sp. PTM05]|uniref:Sigma-70 family RNA polymerase sigma factor n=1 Tax=Streptantibioticus parmotrematis TaxID=2873249 RepID=A0ABS7R1H0_9ACTN|nr:sigma-70 family RNA polymerase sigma factor [Streptantibioticus parmotrematis]MBY8889297.1 sigma-70 family RNA polymerase sigma factor [Streptantibioticus parmotrematis]
MTEFPADDPALPAMVPGLSEPVTEPLAFPVDFEAFYLSHLDVYFEYAEAQLGTRQAAEVLVDEVFLEIHGSWKELLTEGNLEQQAWSALRQAVTDRLERDHRAPSFIIDGTVARLLRAHQEHLSVVESSIGLYSEIAALPPRQFDVIVLRYVLGYPTRRIAWFLGLDKKTVDYHGRRGKERLRIRLGIPATARTRSKEGNVR